MSDLLPCRVCGDVPNRYPLTTQDGVDLWCIVHHCRDKMRATSDDAAAEWNAANAAPDPALMALAKFGALVLDWSPLECGFPTIPGSVVDAMAVRSGCALEDSGDGGHACWTAPNVRLTIARLLAPDGADGAGEVADA